MINLAFLDSVWKCLLTLTVSSTVVFVMSLLCQSVIKRFISNEKSKWFFNYHILFVVCAFISGSTVLIHVDPELIAGCFDRFVASSNSYTITRLLAGGYLVCLVMILIVDSINILLANRIHRTFLKIENHFINEATENLKKHLKIKTPIDILLSEKAASPYVLGLFKRRIVINPFLLSSKDKNQIITILSHELMHIKGHDSAWLLLSHFVKRVFFFNPVSYLFYSKHRLAVEMAADEKAIEQCGIEPRILLKSIIEIAEARNERQDYLLQLNASQEFAEMKERVQSMIDAPRKRVAWVYPAFSMVSLVLSLVVTTVQTNASVGLKNKYKTGEFMCSQIKHEKIIEEWLRLESPPNKCEMK